MDNDVLFDYPCSPTFRRYEDHLLGRKSPPRCESLKDQIFREHMEAYYARQKPSDDTQDARNQFTAKILARVESLQKEVKLLGEEVERYKGEVRHLHETHGKRRDHY